MYIIRGTRKHIFTDEIPPKIPRTADTLGNTIDKKQLNPQNEPQMIKFAFFVNSGVPYIN